MINWCSKFEGNPVCHWLTKLCKVSPPVASTCIPHWACLQGMPVHACCPCMECTLSIAHTHTHEGGHSQSALFCTCMRKQTCTHTGNRGLLFRSGLAVPKGKADVFTFKQYPSGTKPSCCCCCCLLCKWGTSKQVIKSRAIKRLGIASGCFTDKLVTKRVK